MTDYIPLVGRGNLGFKDVFKPGSDMLASDGETATLAHTCGESTRLKWRFFVPPGAKVLQATLYTRDSPTEGVALMRMHQAPFGAATGAVDIATVLQQLLAGAELSFSGPPHAGSIKLCDGARDAGVVTRTGGWVYINAVQMPGNLVYSIDVRVSVDQALYEQWYWSAQWDAQGNPVEGKPAPVVPPQSHEDRVLQACKDSGLVEALCLMLGGVTTEAMARKAVASGVWSALLRLVK